MESPSKIPFVTFIIVDFLKAVVPHMRVVSTLYCRIASGNQIEEGMLSLNPSDSRHRRGRPT